ncbi:FecR family protein [Larkinella bovis]|uniref:FecR family protein n=1 Tax=Larkinella bovis TaxID=683041 RepID=A0ABW0I5M3_9BACT
MVRSRAEYLINKLISNTLSETELEELLEGMEKDEMLQQYSSVLEQYFNTLIEQHDQDTPQPEWRINSGDRMAPAVPTRRIQFFYANYRGLAAFLALLFGLGTAYYFLNKNQPDRLTTADLAGYHPASGSVPVFANQEMVPRGKRKNVRLSDGSTVKLNSDSKISFPKNFGKTGRVVSLNGEAFFDVQRDESRPFVISVNSVKIKVLGTSFNVKDYNDEQELEITVRSGRVSVSLLSGQSAPVVLTKDQKLIFNKTTETFTIIGVNAESESSWITGALQFNNTPLNQVEHTLEKWYDVDIIVEDPTLYQASLTGKHLNENLDSMLESITYALDAQYEIKGRTIILRK